nr:retrovirus-related Pol polyprotein from transposon TNT 1-94 [Tanacetum cinerariifolium]
MANLEFCDTHNMAYLLKTEGSEDGKVKLVSKASIKRYLKLKDFDGINTLPNTEIFKQLALMGYVSNSDKLTFQKGYFSPQWRFLIHDILHCLSPKKTSWEQFSSNIATAIICLATNRTFNFLKMVFEGMVKNLDSVDVRHGGAATTVSSLDTRQGSGNIDKRSSMPHDSPLLRVNTLGSDECSMTLNELTVLCIKLSQKVDSLEADLKQTKQVYGAAYTKLIMNVKRLEKTVKSSQVRRRAKIVVSNDDELEDPSKQGRKVAKVHTYTRRRRAISTASGRITTAEESFSTSGASTPISTAGMVDKGKAIMQESKLEQTTTKLQQRQKRAGYEATSWKPYRNLSDFGDMLKFFDRNDLISLWDLVKERFSTTEPTDDKEKELWVELKRERNGYFHANRKRISIIKRAYDYDDLSKVTYSLKAKESIIVWDPQSLCCMSKGKAVKSLFKAFRVFNSRTQIVEENLHVKFSKSTPNVVGSVLDWLFDIDALTRTMNYEPIVAGTQSNDYADPRSSHDDRSKPLSDDGNKVDEDPRKQANVIHALKDPSWIETMQEDLPQFKLQEVLTLVDLPNRKKAIGTKWVFRNKTDERGIVIRNKEILVAQGYIQEKRLTMMKSLSMLQELKQIKEEVYVCQPPGFEDPEFPNRVYKVEKALYVLHQGPRTWYETLSAYMLDNGFQRGKIGKTIFIKRHKGDIWLVQVYVDDIIFGLTKNELYNAFERFTEVKIASTPMETQKPPLKDEGGEEVDVHMYRSMIGSLMYLTSLRPDIIFAFWSTVMAKTINRKVQLHAKVDGKKIIVIESSVRRDLRLADEEDEAIHKELGDSLVRAATTTSSLEAEQHSGNISKTQSKAKPNEPSSYGTNSGGGPSDEDRLELNELMAFCINLQTRVLDLEKTKTTQSNEIASLKRMVKNLEKKNRSGTHKLKRLYKVGLTARVESLNEESLGGKEVFVAEQEVVSTAATTVTTEELTLAQAIEALKTSKPKVKGIVIQEQEQPDKEEVAIDVIPLAVKSPKIVDWKIHKEGKKSYYQIMRPDGNTLMYMVFSKMLESFDTEDLEDLYKLNAIYADLHVSKEEVSPYTTYTYNDVGKEASNGLSK